MKTFVVSPQIFESITDPLSGPATLWQSDEYADKAEELLAFQEKLSEGVGGRHTPLSLIVKHFVLFCDLVIGSKCQVLYVETYVLSI